jgi:hypothetical protein
MPQFNAYPSLASVASNDLLLVWDDSAGSVKTVDFSDVQGSIDLANTTGTLPIARGGLGVSLVDPGSDKLLFWDTSAGGFAYLTIGTGLTVAGTTISSDGGGGGGGGAPDTANYIIQTTNASLPQAQVLADLVDGIVKNTTGTGELSIATAGTDYVAPGLANTSGLTVSTTARLLGRSSIGAGAIEEIPVSTALDLVGSTQGSILYRGASAWTALTPGTSGQVLRSNGAAANPSWTSASSGDVVGPASALDNAIARYDTTTGKLLQGSTVTISDGGAVNIPAGITFGVNVVTGNHTVLSTDGTVVYTGAGTHTITLVSAASNTGRVIWLKNNGTGAVTIDATGLGQLVPSTGAVDTISLAANEFLIIQSGNNKWQVFSQ